MAYNFSLQFFSEFINPNGRRTTDVNMNVLILIIVCDLPYFLSSEYDGNVFIYLLFISFKFEFVS